MTSCTPSWPGGGEPPPTWALDKGSSCTPCTVGSIRRASCKASASQAGNAASGDIVTGLSEVQPEGQPASNTTARPNPVVAAARRPLSPVNACLMPSVPRELVGARPLAGLSTTARPERQADQPFGVDVRARRP